MKRKKKLMFPVFYEGAFLCFIGYHGPDCTLYDLAAVEGWTKHPLSLKLVRGAFYEASGTPIAAHLIRQAQAQTSLKWRWVYFARMGLMYTFYDLLRLINHKPVKGETK